MAEKSDRNIIKLPVKQSEIQKYDLSPLIKYAMRNNMRLSELTTAELEFLHYEENIEHLLNNAYEKGFRLGQLKAACVLVVGGYCTSEETSEMFGIPIEEIQEWISTCKYRDI